MKRNKKLKRLLISAAALVTAAAIGAGIWIFAGKKGGESVYVYPFSYVGMTEYWGDSQESYGPVTTDKLQTVHISETQTVTEILVSPGDTVKKGDLLMTFDTTLTDLALERERLGVEQLKLQLADAEERLWEINSMVPMVIPDPEPETTPNDEELGALISGAYQLSQQKEYDGSSAEKPLICWMAGTTAADSVLWEAIRQQSQTFRNANAAAAPQDPAVTADPAATPTPTVPPEVNDFYVILKVTEKDRALGGRIVWQGFHVTREPADGSFRFTFFDASAIEDHSLAGMETPPEEPEIDFGSGFTAAQIAEMRDAQEETIRDLEFQVLMAEADYQIMLTEVEDGNVYAEIDGEVVSVLTEEEARETMQPILKVSGGGGFYVEGTVSELQKDSVQIGQEVTVNDWNTGMVYTGTVHSIGDFPVQDEYFSGIGNPNVSYYPMRVFVDESADLQAGSYVSIMYSGGAAENGLYLENPFVRQENGRSYVMVRGEDGTLEQRFVTTGKSLWGSYTEILSGLSETDYIAFPYGKTVKPGASTAEGDYSTLYG
ncbi:MAG: HlyD family efflux transporter periplasmic adaptor subunit [Oscillospiraceae bacterium]|nr:HlyD family efflux transporter periplasmic adaptor subunit [Oscillospiraceae bacterium]